MRSLQPHWRNRQSLCCPRRAHPACAGAARPIPASSGSARPHTGQRGPGSQRHNPPGSPGWARCYRDNREGPWSCHAGKNQQLREPARPTPMGGLVGKHSASSPSTALCLKGNGPRPQLMSGTALELGQLKPGENPVMGGSNLTPSLSSDMQLPTKVPPKGLVK